MTPLFRTARRAEEFAGRVDGATARPSEDAVTERLVAITALLRAHGAADAAAVPRDVFAADLRERLMAEAVTVLTPASDGLALPVRTRGRRERRLVAVASVAVLLGGTAGMATAAQDALPGEALYPIKRGIEKAEVGLSMSSAGQGRDLLHQASDRLDEAQALVAADTTTGTPRVPDTIRSFTSQARQGADLLMSSYEDSRDPATVATLRDFAASALRQIEAMDSSVPPEARGDLRAAALALREVDARATRLCDTCSDLPALAIPRVFLASAEVDRAMRRVQAAQPDNSHPVVAAKQDVRRAAGGAADDPGRASGRSGTGSTSGSTGGGRDDGSGTGADGGPSLPGAPQAPTPGAGAPLPGPSIPSLPTPRVPVDTDLDVGTITDGLGDTVETILPDPGTGGLPR